MCCFSREIDRVADTNLFARASKDGRQFLIYSMELSTKDDVAMILPIPVPKDVKEDAVKFINLEKYPKIFDDLDNGFPKPPPPRATRSDPKPDEIPLSEPPLKVVEVGSFEASFVPTVKDFARLDARFRLPDDIWSKLGGYKDYGFAVFKLKKGEQKVHPMAFEFPRRDAKKLFFPTVHIHDGKVHDKADFDHTLYCQENEDEQIALTRWQESPSHATEFVKIDQTEGIVNKDAHVYRLRLRGTYKNEDVIV